MANLTRRQWLLHGRRWNSQLFRCAVAAPSPFFRTALLSCLFVQPWRNRGEKNEMFMERWSLMRAAGPEVGRCEPVFTGITIILNHHCAIEQRTWLQRRTDFLQSVYSSQQSIKIQTENGLDGHFVDALMDACCSHIFREVSPFWSPSVFVVMMYSDYGCLVQIALQ